MESHWEADVDELLKDLCAAQDEMIEVLAEKRGRLVAADVAGMQALEGREQDLIERLQSCHRRRGELLAQAAGEGMPSDSIRSLAGALADDRRRPVSRRVREASGRARLLQHHSLTNWVVAQRTMLHLSQLLEIIATGGRQHPTYQREGASPATSGALVDQAA